MAFHHDSVNVSNIFRILLIIYKPTELSLKQNGHNIFEYTVYLSYYVSRLDSYPPSEIDLIIHLTIILFRFMDNFKFLPWEIRGTTYPLGPRHIQAYLFLS